MFALIVPIVVGGAFGPIGLIIGGILTFLGGLFSLFKGNTGAIVDAVKSLAGYTGDLARRTADAIEPLEGGGFGKVLKRIAEAGRRVWDRLKDWVLPIVKFLKRVRELLDFIFEKFVRPILMLIQHIRQFLLLLRLLHIKWAEDLDRVLRQVQAEIAKPFEIVRKQLNGVLDVLELVLHPGGWLSVGPLFGAIWRDIGLIARMMNMARRDGVKDGDPATVRHYSSFLSRSDVQARALLNARGEFDSYDRTLHDQVVQEMRAQRDR